jgi:hypothetical protein
MIGRSRFMVVGLSLVGAVLFGGAGAATAGVLEDGPPAQAAQAGPGTMSVGVGATDHNPDDGDTVTYGLRVTNNGAAASGVSVELTLPMKVGGAVVSPSSITCAPGTAPFTLICQLGRVPAGGSVAFYVTGEVDSEGPERVLALVRSGQGTAMGSGSLAVEVEEREDSDDDGNDRRRRGKGKGGGDADEVGRDGALCFGRKATIEAQGGVTEGTNGDDVIIGTDASDAINGNGGDDRICAGGGDDFVDFGSQTGGAEPPLTASSGFDRHDGEDDEDDLNGGYNTGSSSANGDGNILLGGADRDFLLGDDGPDRLSAEEGGAGLGGSETVFGLGDNDDISGGEGDDFLSGDGLGDGFGDDSISGGDGNDFLDGDDASLPAVDGGDDTLGGGSGEDELEDTNVGDSDEADAGADTDSVFLADGDGDDSGDGGPPSGGSETDTCTGDEGDQLTDCIATFSIARGRSAPSPRDRPDIDDVLDSLRDRLAEARDRFDEHGDSEDGSGGEESGADGSAEEGGSGDDPGASDGDAENSDAGDGQVPLTVLRGLPLPGL